ncbi:MAG TPA: hypothetical protein VMS17_13290 [Gemmataceae bacterium]|nr:hypothetical protein [Gemmataceae bacterium]
MTTAVLRQPTTTAAGASLTLARADIQFSDAGPRRVAVSFRVRNDGDEPSAPTLAVLSAAPLGAFVPWRSLALVHAPALAPGESAVLRTEAIRPAVAPLGPPDRVPPRRLLTALGAADDRPQPTPVALPPDLMDLVGRPNPHWAGNLNVFVAGRAVERHLAQTLRVYPGRVNLALFVVGSRRDAYRFHVVGEGPDWKARLHDITEGKTLQVDVSSQPAVAEDEWIETPGQRMMMLALEPPADCGAGAVAVHVTQRSTGKEAVVEFSLDPTAAGPGCFVV